MTRLALDNPFAVLMACIGIVVFAAVITPRMNVDTFPELTPPVLVVGTQAPGMGPQDVEKTITWRFEKFVAATPGVDHVQSVSRSGLSVIYVWLKWGTNLNAAQTLVQQQVQFAMSSVPKSLGIVPPFVLQYDPTNAPIVQVAVYGGGLRGAQLYDYAANVISPLLEGIQGVASASPNGGRERQINVVVDPGRASVRGLTSIDVAGSVSEANALLPSGRLISTHLDANVYTNAVPSSIAEIGEASVQRAEDVLIRDVAGVADGGTPDTQAVSINGEPGVYLNVLRVPGGNVLAIVDAVKGKIASLRDLPPGMKVEPIFDQSVFVRATYSALQREIFQAMILIALVILVFLQSFRSVVVALIAIPVSFSVILLVLYATGQTLNSFTMGGLTLAMGPLVNISVVVLEAIHRRRKAGAGKLEASLEGARSVAVPAIAATLATVAVLLPVVLLQGLAKKLFSPLALTVAVAMFAGYFVSMLVTPVACRYILGDVHAASHPIIKRLEAWIDGGSVGYAELLKKTLAYRAWILGASLVLIAASVVVAVDLPSSFFPEIDESMERIYVRVAPGTSIEESTRKINEMGRMIEQSLPPRTIKLWLSNVGKPRKARTAMNSPNAGPHMGFLRIELVPRGEREMSQREVADRIRTLMNQRYPGVDFLQWPGGLVASVFSNGYNAPLVVEVRGEKLEELAEASRLIAEVASTVGGVRDVWTSLEMEYPEIHIDTDRQAANLVGLSARDAAQTALEATLGNLNTPSIWVDGANGQSYFVVTSYDTSQIEDREGLGRVPARAYDTGSVALGTYGILNRSVGPITIERNQLTRSAYVMMQTERRDIGTAAAELERKLREDSATKDLELSFVGQVDLMRTTFSGLGVAVALAIMIVFMVMATQFKSLRLPFAMLLTIPVSLFGVVTALVMTGQGWSITALMGVLMVIGITVPNGILLVDVAQQKLAEGMDAVAAVVVAGRARVVPIAMTSLATIIGLSPVALGLSEGAEANRPLALAVVGGLASSPLLSLFLVPAMFTLLTPKRASNP